MEFFNFGLEQKLCHHISEEFHDDSDGNGFTAQKLIIDPLMALIDLNDPKMEFFNFGLEQKLDHHSCVEFHSNSYCDGFKDQNR